MHIGAMWTEAGEADAEIPADLHGNSSDFRYLLNGGAPVTLEGRLIPTQKEKGQLRYFSAR